MNRKILITALVLIGLVTAILVGSNTLHSNEEYLRIHIRANSNDEIDQNIKYEIKGEIVKFLNPLFEGVDSVSKARETVIENMQNIEDIADAMLKKYGFNYDAECRLAKEKFPVRHYGNLTLEEGVYEALIVELGEAKGDNWWCVVFPPLCFVTGEEYGNKEFRYVSKIKEIIDKILA